MNIHEYQAKQLLGSFGLPVSSGFAILSRDDVEAAIDSLLGPVYVVKSQIHAGGRGKGKFRELGSESAGGVRLAFSSGEVRAHVDEMLGNTLVTNQTGPLGKQVNRLYLEDGADISIELYLSILLNRETGRVSFVVSTQGGIDIEEVAKSTPEKIHTIDFHPDDGCTSGHAARICDALALTGLARSDGMTIFPILYRAFVKKDMSLLEINPLVILKNGHLCLLDAKISFDDNALFRQPDIVRFRDESEEDEREIKASKHDLAYVALDGDIGCMVNGAGLAMATMDIIKLYGAEPANFLDVGGGASREKVTAAFKIITDDPNVKGILVNIFGGIMRCDIIAKGVIAAVEEVGLQVPLVVRLEGTNVKQGKDIIQQSGLNVIVADDLDDAAQKIVQAVKGVGFVLDQKT